MKIGLNNFLRFMAASTPIGQVNQVTEAVKNYRHFMDYYKDFRPVALHALRTRDPSSLDVLIDAKQDDSKARNYGNRAARLKQWIAKTEYEFVLHPKAMEWRESGLKVPINPEVCLKISGKVHMVKLYMAQGTLTKEALAGFGYLVTQTHGQWAAVTPGILNLNNGRYIPVPRPDPRIGVWVRSQAVSFISIWQMMQPEKGEAHGEETA